ncbi:MAG: hypothetical protein ACIAXF_12520 [Phycisphaerales bacterium JB063]
MHGPDYILNINGLTPIPHKPDATPKARAWIAVNWTCCSVYSRIYKHRDGDRYEGRCPKCMRQVTAPIGPRGTNKRFFEAG